jgi:hypothetical protein
LGEDVAYVFLEVFSDFLSNGVGIPVVAASSLEPGVFYCSSEGMVYRSEDDGLRWRKLPVNYSQTSDVRIVFRRQVMRSGGYYMSDRDADPQISAKARGWVPERSFSFARASATASASVT